MIRRTLRPRFPRSIALCALPFTVGLFLTTLIAPGRASAQGRMGWSELSGLGLTNIFVFDERGGETSGVVRRVTADSLVIMLPGGDDRAYQTSQVRRVERRGDSLKNGALIGAGIGSLPFLMLLGDCSGEGCLEAAVGFALVGAGVYGLLGAGIDAMLVGRTTVYTPQSTPARLSVSPLVRPSGAGMRLGLRVGTK